MSFCSSQIKTNDLSRILESNITKFEFNLMQKKKKLTEIMKV